MIDNLARDLQLLQRADWLITKMWVNIAARHFCICRLSRRI